MSTSRRAFLATTAAFAAGFAVAALLHAYPMDHVTRHRYCQLCAEYEETYREAVILRNHNASRPTSPRLQTAQPIRPVVQFSQLHALLLAVILGAWVWPLASSFLL